MGKIKIKRPYWLWDYDLAEKDVRRILRGKNEVDRLPTLTTFGSI